MRFAVKALFLLSSSLAAIAQSTSAFPPQINHVVVIFQENRTPDNLFHFLSPLCPIPGGATGLNACTPSPVTSSCYDISPCGLSNQSGTVVPVTLTGVPLKGSVDPNHSHKAFEQMCDPDPVTFACRNDGAWQIVTNNGSYGFVENPTVTNFDGSTGTLLGPYLTFAEQYGWANFMYQTNQGPSYPAHQFLFSGTSAQTGADDAASTFVSENFGPKGVAAGCLAPANAFNFLLSPNPTGICPTGCTCFDNNTVAQCKLPNGLTFPNPVGTFCYSHKNMATLLDNATTPVSWKYYAPSAGSIWTAPNSFKSICQPQFSDPTNPNSPLVCTGSEWNAKVDIANLGTDILRDITNCNLPSVSWVIPNGTWSDHAGSTDNFGPSWVAAVINAIGTNPTCPAGTADAGQNFWQSTAIVVTWDDWGGWSDNQPANVLSGLPCSATNGVANPCPGDYQYGFRVPLLVVSAYTKQGTINNANHDFGSILRMIENIYGLGEGALGFADARATNDLRDFFTLTTARTYTVVPALEPASFFLAQNAAATPPDDDDGTDVP